MRLATAATILFAFFTIALPAHAIQDNLPPATWQQDGPHTHAETVLGKLVQGDNENAFKLLFSKGRYPQQTLEKIQFDYYQTVKKQGNPYGYEKVFEQQAGKAVVRIRYVLLFKTQPMMFDLFYYGTGKDWLLKSFTISRDIKKIFER